MIVIDASVAVKWYFPETGSDAAIDLLNGDAGILIAPDLLAIEVSSALVRMANMHKAYAAAARTLLSQFHALLEDGGVELFRTFPSIVAEAAEAAVALGHPIKDCIYLVLAMRNSCPLLTADARFAAKATAVYQHVEVF